MNQSQKSPAAVDRIKVWKGVCARLGTTKMNSKRGRQVVNRYSRSMGAIKHI